MQLVRIGSGPGKSIYAIEIKGKCILREYLNGLDDTSLKQFFALFNRIIEDGPPTNIRKFRHIKDQIYELKIRNGGRILGFFPDHFLPQSLILTHGFPKPHGKKLSREISKSLKYRSDLEKQIKKNKKITIK